MFERLAESPEFLVPPVGSSARRVFREEHLEEFFVLFFSRFVEEPVGDEMRDEFVRS